MIFQHSWQKILSGQKTQTRRLAKDSDRLWAVEVEDKESKIRPPPQKVLWRGSRARWRTGRTYAVQPGRNEQGIARIRLLDIRYQLLGHTSEAEARAEGFSGLEEFQETWYRIHGHYNPEQPVWVLEFRLINGL